MLNEGQGLESRKEKLVDQVARRIGRTRYLPRKIRANVLRCLVGSEAQNPGFNFETLACEQLYRGCTDSHIDWHVYYFGQYDPVGISMLQEVVARVEIRSYWDVGANTGTHTLPLAKNCESVCCFEPFPQIREALQENLDLNEARNVKVFDFGLSDIDCEKGFQVGKDGNWGQGRFVDDDESRTLKLQLRNGDGFAEESNLGDLGLIKIDVEGWEQFVVDGLKKTLERFRPIVFWEATHGLRDVGLLAFPNEYLTFKVTHKNSWYRDRPRLIECSQTDRGNLLSLPRERIHLFNDIIG